MFDQLLVGVQCHPYELIVREEEEEVVQAKKSLTLLIPRCNLATNGSPQEPLLEWMRTIGFLFKHHNGPQTIISHDNKLSHLLDVT